MNFAIYTNYFTDSNLISLICVLISLDTLGDTKEIPLCND